MIRPRGGRESATMIRKAAGPLGLPPWATRGGPLTVLFSLVVWAGVLLFSDFRTNQQQRAIDDRNATLKQTAALQSLADDRREETRLLAELVALLKRPGNEKWAELNVLVRKLNEGETYDEKDTEAMRRFLQHGPTTDSRRAP